MCACLRKSMLGSNNMDFGARNHDEAMSHFPRPFNLSAIQCSCSLTCLNNNRIARTRERATGFRARAGVALQTWAIQYINLLAGNVGLVILAGQFLKVRPDLMRNAKGVV